MKTANEVARAVDADLAGLRDQRVLAHIAKLRVDPPMPIRLQWDYGKREVFDGWLVLRDPAHGTGIAYCGEGFGPKCPWGLVGIGEPCPSMGMDSGWFRRFLDAYLDSLPVCDLSIWKAVRRNRDWTARMPITEELSWNAAWEVVERMRKEDPEHRYDTEHDIPY